MSEFWNSGKGQWGRAEWRVVFKVSQFLFNLLNCLISGWEIYSPGWHQEIVHIRDNTPSPHKPNKNCSHLNDFVTHFMKFNSSFFASEKKKSLAERMEKLHFNNKSWRWQSSGLGSPPHLFELQYSAQSFHHGVLLVMLHQICQRVKLLPSTNIIFEILERQISSK